MLIMVYNHLQNGMFSILCLSFLLFGSCKLETKKEAQEISTRDFQYLKNSASGNTSLPRLFSTENKLFLSWVEEKDSLTILNYDVFENGSWKDSEEIISGSNWFTNWADFPAIAVSSNGNILTSFLEKSAKETYTYDIKLNLYNAATNSWKKNFILHNDATKSEHGFVSIAPYSDNTFQVVWLDGRETAGKSHGGGQMTLRGAIVSEDGSIKEDRLLDERICDCCQTGIAVGPNDEIVASYRDRSEGEIRDISTVRWQSKEGWSKPEKIGNDNWKIAGCPVNGPSIDSYKNNFVVAWFTAANDSPKVQVAFSQDIGKTFGLPIRIDNGNALGRVDVAMISNTTAIICWMENKGEETLIQVMKVKNDGSIGLPVTISKTIADRASGFPQMEVMGSTIYLAWTDVQEDTSSIKTIDLSLESL